MTRPRISSTAPDLLEALMWKLQKGQCVAQCELWRHPLGWEVRCDVDGELVQAAVLRRRESAEDQAHDWQQAFRAKGCR